MLATGATFADQPGFVAGDLSQKAIQSSSRRVEAFAAAMDWHIVRRWAPSTIRPSEDRVPAGVAVPTTAARRQKHRGLSGQRRCCG